jgi:hypothetical protein
MPRLFATLLLLLGLTGAALADDSTTSSSAQKEQDEISSCRDALPQIAPVLKATEDYTQQLKALGPNDEETSIPEVLTGARRAALANVFRDFKSITPDVLQLQGDLEVLTEIVNACASGQLTP